MRFSLSFSRLWSGVVLAWLLSTSFLSASAQTWPWAARTTGTGMARLNNTVLDAAGNAYVVGHYTGTITCGTTTLIGKGTGYNLLVGKLSPTGQWLWAKSGGRVGGHAIGNGVAVDRSGNVYVGGWCNSGTYAFDAVPLTIASVGCAAYALLGKLSPTGQWQWVKGAGSGSMVQDLAIDPTGNVCAVGLTRSQRPFILPIAPPPFGDYAFATKLSPAGVVLWDAAALVAGGADDVAVDRAGNFYMSGRFKGAVTFGTIALTAFGGSDGFVAKLSAAGQWQWVQRMGSTGNDIVTDVAVDAAGNVYTASQLKGRVTFGTTTFQPTLSGTYGVIAKYGPTGQALWAVRPETTTAADSQWPVALTIDANNSLHALGINMGTTRFGATALTTPAYLARLDAGTGAWQWTQGVAQVVNSGNAISLAVGPAGALWMGGDYMAAFRLGTLSLPSNGTTYQGFLGKLAFAAPTLTSLSPASGAVGSTVTLNGANLSAVTAVKFGTRVASYTVVSATRLTVTVPVGATTGTIAVTTTGGAVTSATAFTIVAPTVSTFSPASGPAGTVVTVNGTGFIGATGVKFNNVAATSFTVVSATRLTAIVPAGATTGKITVLALGGAKLSAANFVVGAPRAATVVVAPVVGPAPSAEALSLYPNPAHGSVQVTVPAGTRQVELLDAAGLAVRSQLLAAEATEAVVSLDGLRPGLYTVRAGRVLRRLVVE